MNLAKSLLFALSIAAVIVAARSVPAIAAPEGMSARESVIVARVLKKVRSYIRKETARTGDIVEATTKAARGYIKDENLKPGSEAKVTTVVTDYISKAISVCGDGDRDVLGSASKSAKRVPAQSGQKKLDCLSTILRNSAVEAEGEDPTTGEEQHNDD